MVCRLPQKYLHQLRMILLGNSFADLRWRHCLKWGTGIGRFWIHKAFRKKDGGRSAVILKEAGTLCLKLMLVGLLYSYG